jgi:hypothetical protein
MKRIGIISNVRSRLCQQIAEEFQFDNINHARFKFVKIIIHIHILEGCEDSVVLYLE